MDMTQLSTLKRTIVICMIGVLVLGTVGLVAQPTALQQSPQLQQNSNVSQANTTAENRTDGENEMGRSAGDILQAAQESYNDIEDFNATLESSSTISNESGVVQTANTTAKLSVKQPDKIRLEIR
jgi:outer membrane lipoprotein-sorting protein